MRKNNNTNPHNQANQTLNRRQRRTKTPAAKKPAPDRRTDEADYQKLPPGLRPFAGFAQRDPLDYGSHPYPSMLRFAKHLALHFDAPRTRHSYYRQMRLEPVTFFRSARRVDNPKKENGRVGWAPVIETFCFCLEGCKRGVFSSTQEQLCVIG